MRNKILKYAGLLILAVLLVIQFIHPEKNVSDDQTKSIAKTFPLPTDVENILKTSCYDCHSNHTEYPWYSKLQPVDWWLADHVDEGKEELNFSEFASYRPWRQFHKLEKIGKELEEHEMPLPSYLFIHRSSKLSDAQQELITKWANSLCDSLKMRYPPDSLINPKKRQKKVD